MYPAHWRPREPFRSVCRRRLAALPWARPPLHEPPGFDCVCGVHAVRDVTRALAVVRRAPVRIPADRLRVVGSVLLWGRVVEADGGWRGELAYPQRLVVPVPERRLGARRCRLLADRVAGDLLAYGVEVQIGDPVTLLEAAGAPRSRAPGPVSLGSGMPVP